jgi:hypothetical protein
MFVKFFLRLLNFTSELYFLNMQPIFSYLDPLIVCLNLMVALSKNLQIFSIIEFSKDYLIALNPYYTSALSCLKGQCHEIFDFFSWISSQKPLSGAPWLANISQVFGKVWNDLWGLGETDSWKKPEAKNLNTVLLKGQCHEIFDFWFFS